MKKTRSILGWVHLYPLHPGQRPAWAVYKLQAAGLHHEKERLGMVKTDLQRELWNKTGFSVGLLRDLALKLGKNLLDTTGKVRKPGFGETMQTGGTSWRLTSTLQTLSCDSIKCLLTYAAEVAGKMLWEWEIMNSWTLTFLIKITRMYLFCRVVENVGYFGFYLY